LKTWIMEYSIELTWILVKYGENVTN